MWSLIGLVIATPINYWLVRWLTGDPGAAWSMFNFMLGGLYGALMVRWGVW